MIGSGHITVPGWAAGNAIPSPLATFGSDLALWLEAENYNATTGDWTDSSGNGRDFSQGTAGLRPTKTAANASLNNQPTADFDGTDDYVSIADIDIAAAGTDCLIWVVHNPTKSTGGFDGIFTSNPVAVWHLGNVADQTGWRSGGYTNVGVAVNGAQISVNVLTAPTGTMRRNRSVLGAGTYNAGIIDGAAAVGAEYTGNAATCYKGAIAEVGIIKRAATAAEIYQLERYLSHKYGIATDVASPLEIFGSDAVLWLRADQYNASTGDWLDLSGNGRDYSQATAGSRPTKTAANASFNNQPTADFDGGDIVQLADINAAVSGTEMGIYIVQKATGLGASQILWDVNTGRVIAYHTNPTANFGFLEGANNRSFGAATTDTQQQIWNLIDGAAVGYRNGTQIGTAQGYTLRAIDAASSVGGSAGGTPAYTGSIAEVVIVKRAMTAAEIAALNAYGADRYGL